MFNLTLIHKINTIQATIGSLATAQDAYECPLNAALHNHATIEIEHAADGIESATPAKISKKSLELYDSIEEAANFIVRRHSPYLNISEFWDAAQRGLELEIAGNLHLETPEITHSDLIDVLHLTQAYLENEARKQAIPPIEALNMILFAENRRRRDASPHRESLVLHNPSDKVIQALQESEEVSSHPIETDEDGWKSLYITIPRVYEIAASIKPLVDKVFGKLAFNCDPLPYFIIPPVSKTDQRLIVIYPSISGKDYVHTLAAWSLDTLDGNIPH